jgi:ribonucleoside-diphosphate reductase alpha chain
MITVVKRNGSKEPLDISKFQKVTAFACDGLSGVSSSELELKTQLSFYNNIKSTDIQETLIKAAADLISEESPNYQYVAGRLVSYHLRKQIFGQYQPTRLYDHIKNVVKQGFYTKELLEYYTEQEIDQIDKLIDHSRDDLLTFAGIEQFRSKYLVRNRVTGQVLETPQIAMALISMVAFINYNQLGHDRIKWVKDFYDALSTFDISLPTPIMAGLRTPDKQFSSCVLIETDDSLDSINATASAIVKYVSQKAGIGIGAGRIRAIDSPIRNGAVVHTGVIPFYKYFQSAVRSCSQGSIRTGSATLYYPLWHLEIEDMLVLKNNKGTEDNRIRHMDYGVQFNRVMYERLLSGGKITLFSPSDVPDLYDAFFEDTDKFRELYEKYEKDRKIRKRTVNALELFSQFIQERKDTGRIYLMNVDHCNDHGSFDKTVAPIRQSNLCAEIALPTKPLNNIDDEQGRIQLCTLGAINWGKIKKPEDFERPCTLVVRALDNILSYQNYPVKAAEIATREHRPLGVGIINFAYWLAKNDMTYQNPDLEKIHQFTEGWSYYLIKASVDLAEEIGCCERSDQTLYHQGIMPIDTYKNDVDILAEPVYYMDWEHLREKAKKFGIRNATVMALMPAESSALVSNSTNGIEPPRSLVSIKQSKEAIIKQVVPGIHKLKNKYDLLWNQKSPDGYLKITAVLQKFIDQAISVNTSYNPKFYPDEQIPLSEMLNHIVFHYKMGGKTLYYNNTNDGATDEFEPLPASTDLEENCDGCIL